MHIPIIRYVYIYITLYIFTYYIYIYIYYILYYTYLHITYIYILHTTLYISTYYILYNIIYVIIYIYLLLSFHIGRKVSSLFFHVGNKTQNKDKTFINLNFYRFSTFWETIDLLLDYFDQHKLYIVKHIFDELLFTRRAQKVNFWFSRFY